MGIEPTWDFVEPHAGFEDQERHQNALRLRDKLFCLGGWYYGRARVDKKTFRESLRTGVSRHSAPGVRPSAGAAATERAGAPEYVTAALVADVVALEDGRTPGAVSGCAHVHISAPRVGASQAPWNPIGKSSIPERHRQAR